MIIDSKLGTWSSFDEAVDTDKASELAQLKAPALAPAT